MLFGTSELHQVAHIYVDDMLQDAEQARQHKRAQQERIATPHYVPALAWLGTQLIAWGWRLRARYGAIEFRA